MKSATRKKLTIILGIVVLVAIIAAFLLPRLIDPNQYHGRIVSELEKALGGTVRIGHITWGVSSGVWIEAQDFSVAGSTAMPVDFKLPRFYAKVSIPPLLKKKIVLKNLRLESPEAILRLAPSRQEPDQKLQSPPAATKPAGIALPIEIEELTLTGGRVQVLDSLTLPGQQAVRAFSDVAITATNMVLGQVMAFDVAMRDDAPSGFGAVKAKGTFSGLTEAFTLENAKLTVKATLSPLHIDAVKPYLLGSPLVQRLGGSVSLAVNYETHLSSYNRWEGSVDLSKVTYADPSLWEGALRADEAAITYRVILNPTQLLVEKLALHFGNLSLTVSGGVENWSERPVIRNAQLSSELPLLGLVPLMPWKLLGEDAGILRPIFEGGGKIVIEQAVLPELSVAGPPPTAEALLSVMAVTAQVSGLSIQLSPKVPKIRNINGSLSVANGVAQVEGLRAQFGTIDLPQISARITKLPGKPRVEATVKGDLKVRKDSDEEVAVLLRRLGLEEVSGAATVDSAVALETSQPEEVQVQGNIGLRDVQAKTVLSPARIEGLNADLAVTPDVGHITNLSTTVVVPATASGREGRFELQMQARVDEWSRQPAVTLQRFNTSPVSLPVVASLVPWEQLGDSFIAVKETLLNGGTVTIEEASLPRIDLLDLQKKPAQLLSQAKAAANFADLVAEPSSILPSFEEIEGRIKLEKGALTATGVKGRVGPLSLPELNVRVTRLEDHPRVTVRAKGPIDLAATRDLKVEDLLKRYGLKTLLLSADIDMRADFDESRQDAWIADGSLVFTGVRAESYPGSVVMDDLRGRVTVSRRKSLNITAEEITGQVNQAPVRLSGKFLGVGTPNLLVDVKAYAKQLDLADLRELFPALKKHSLAGKLDMDLDVYIPYAAAKKSRLHGMLATQHLHFLWAGISVEKGDAEWNLTGNTATIKRFQVQVNDQLLVITGKIANPVEPEIDLVVTSPDLNLDRLLLQERAEKSGEKSSIEAGARSQEKTGKAELPPIARNTAARLRINAEQGQYKDLRFQNLKLDADYDRGVITQCDLSLDTESGHVATKGSVDLWDPEHPAFTASPKVTSVMVEKIAPVIGIPNVSVTGPISWSGELQGKAGSSEEILASLRGNLEIQVGPGKMARLGRGGELMARMLSLTTLRGILSGSVFDDFANKGLPYRRITAQASFDNGNMELKDFRFESNVMNMGAQGRINLVEEQIKMGVKLKPLGAVTTVVGMVPLVGKAAAGLTEIHLDVSGSMEDPQISIVPGQGIADAVQDEARGVGRVLKGATDFLGAGEKQETGK
jgi:hypothetical protein